VLDVVDPWRSGAGGAARPEPVVTLPQDLRARVDAWIAGDPDDDTVAELEALLASADGPGADAPAAGAELAARFAGRLEFGTAGLRAPMGGGPMRMNRLVVRQAAAGLARHLGPGATVVIGFDARHRSDVFALDSARVLAAAGCRVVRFATTVPTPVLAFAIRHLGTDAGVMCTASHNPRHDNGYKVYLGDGAQIIPPTDTAIAAAIDAVVEAAVPIPLAAEDDPAISVVGPEVVDAYVEHASVPGRSAGSSGPVVVYTPMHGVGRAVAHEVLARSGFDRVHDVAAQAEPDPEFPTVAFPNPEEPGALDLAIEEARARAADVVLANDPDADRLGVVVPVAPGDPFDDGSGWRILTGNEIGAVLAEHVLASTAGSDRLVVTTFVSSRLLARQAEHHGVHHTEVLTGFKWIVRPGMERPDLRFVFGYEEALGFTVDPYVRDKDGITAARAFAEVTAATAAAGRTIGDVLEDLARRHGHHATRTWSARFDGPHAGVRMAAVVGRWRDRPPVALGDRAVARVTDMAPGGDLPPTDAVVVDLVDGGRVVLRPSGTEPKVKVYLEVVEQVGDGPSGYATAVEQGRRTVEDLRLAVAASLGLPRG
jgi:phosphomannomutase